MWDQTKQSNTIGTYTIGAEAMSVGVNRHLDSDKDLNGFWKIGIEIQY